GLFDTGDQPASAPSDRPAEEPVAAPVAAAEPPPAEQTRITSIRTRGGSDTGRVRREAPPVATSNSAGGRDLPMAVAVGFGLAASAGRTPVAAWISPKKTVEGLVGGALLTLLTLFVIKLIGVDPWSDANWGKVLLFAIVIMIVAPIGDFTESMFKRNLD